MLAKRISLRATFVIVASLSIIGFQNCSSNNFQLADGGSLNQGSEAAPVCANGDKKSGYAMSSVLSPLTCGSMINTTCVNGQWDRQEPLYPSCLQQCVHPNTKVAVDAGGVYYSFKNPSGKQVPFVIKEKSLAPVTKTLEHFYQLQKNTNPA